MDNQCIPPLCDLLSVEDSKVVEVALNGLENIMRSGKEAVKQSGINPFIITVEECRGM